MTNQFGHELSHPEKGGESWHIDDGVLYQAMVGAFNTLVENTDYFMEKWRERLGRDNVLARYKARQFIEIMAEAEAISEFDCELYFALVEKMIGFDSGRMVVSLLDGTEIK